MKTLVATFALVLVTQAQAQTNQGNYNQQEPAIQAQRAVGQAESSIAPAQSAGNPIYILNNQRLQGYQGTNQGAQQGAQAAAVQEQPVSVVQDSPLKVSPADQMRKRRAESEAQTEDSIAQALEKARIEDEVRRRDKFNNAINPVNAAAAQNNAAAQNSAAATVVGNNNTIQETNVIQQPQAVQQQQPQQVQQVAPVKIAEPKKVIVIEKEQKDEDVVVIKKETKDEEKVDIRNEIRTALEETHKKVELERQTYYVSGMASFGNYNNIVNVDRSLGWGFAVGMTTPERFVFEGSFLYGTYKMADLYACSFGCGMPSVVDMTQYNFAGAAKYQILPGKFKPVVGGIAGYTRRNYNIPPMGTYRSTDALDIGALIGADLAISNSFAIGLDFRYMTNIGYRVSNENFPYSMRAYNDPEKLDYYTINLLAKFLF